MRLGIAKFLHPFLLIFQKVRQEIACPGIFLYLNPVHGAKLANFIYSGAASVEIIPGVAYIKFRWNVDNIAFFHESHPIHLPAAIYQNLLMITDYSRAIQFKKTSLSALIISAVQFNLRTSA